MTNDRPTFDSLIAHPTIRSDWDRMIERHKMGPEQRKRTQPIRAFFHLVKMQWRKRGYWSLRK